MRHGIAIALAPLALLACGSAGDPSSAELVGSTAQAVTRCQVGYHAKCNALNQCTCVLDPPPPPVCSWVSPPPPEGEGDWIESWAVQSPDGSCRDIPGVGGTWKELASQYAGQTPVPGCFDGVPNEYLDGVESVQQCSDVFDAGSCCTYVWWPSSFTVPVCDGSEPDGQYPQDTQALCTRNGLTLVALKHYFCVLVGPNAKCPKPGGGGCGTCARG